jgi:hypothetical protein
MLASLMLATLLARQDAGPLHAPKIALPDENPVQVRVLVLDYDPVVASQGGKKFHEVLNIGDPHKLADAYIRDVQDSSGGFIRYRIAEWRDLNELPDMADGVALNLDELAKGQAAPIKATDLDIPKILTKNDAKTPIEGNKIDEVWIFGGPGFSAAGASMAGPGSFSMGAGVYGDFSVKNGFVVQTFNYKQGVAAMLETLGERVEACMDRAYTNPDGTPVAASMNLWQRFTGYEMVDPGHASVGTCHFPPNAQKPNDFSDPRTVMSTADDWLVYPQVVNQQQILSNLTWGGPDYERNYLKWWMRHLPRIAGVAPDRRQNNWWKYAFQFNAYDAHGMRLVQGK